MDPKTAVKVSELCPDPFLEPLAKRSAPTTSAASQRGTGSNMTRRQKGEKGAENNKSRSNRGPGANNPTSRPADPVAPLPVNDNTWKPKRPTAQHANSPELVDWKVRRLLNKLAMENFDSISDQIIQWASKSEKEKDGRTLIQVIRLVYEESLNAADSDEATWRIEMYVRLCRKMMDVISPLVQDDGIRDVEGTPIAGGKLFRKYLLNRCQEDFERIWFKKEAIAAAATSKATQGEAGKLEQAHEKQGTDETILYSDEYYTARKASRRNVGLMKFIGELFKVQMLTERIMHECVKKLLADNPEEEELEGLCTLLTTTGQSLDTPKARAHMDAYFLRMNKLSKTQSVSPRMQFMLQDVIELREREWVSLPLPTIVHVHENAAEEKSAIDRDAFTRQISMSRGGFRRGGGRGGHPQVGPDRWAVAGSGPSRIPSKAGDLSNFGKIYKSAPMTFGPTSVFAGKNREGKRDSIPRTNSSSNMFSMLQAAEAAEPVQNAPEPQRKRLILQPRTIPTEGDAPVPKSSASENADPEDTGGMSEEVSETKIKEDIKEFFRVRSIDEAEFYWTTLPTAHHQRLINKLVSRAVEAKEADAQLVANLFKSVVGKDLCSFDAFEQGFVNIANMIEDIAIDAPKAVTFFGMIVRAVDLDEGRRRRIADKASEGHEDGGKEEYAERILKAIS